MDLSIGMKVTFHKVFLYILPCLHNDKVTEFSGRGVGMDVDELGKKIRF